MGTPWNSIVLWSVFIIFSIIKSAECGPTGKEEIDTFSDDWKRYPTHMEFRNWLLNQFRDHGLVQENKGKNSKPILHILIIGDLGDSSSSSDYSDSYSDESYSYSESESYSDESSGDSDEESASVESTENPIVEDGFIEITLDDHTIGRSDGKKDKTEGKNKESNESEDNEEDSDETSGSSEEETSTVEIEVEDDIERPDYTLEVVDEALTEPSFRDDELNNNMIVSIQKRSVKRGDNNG